MSEDKTIPFQPHDTLAKSFLTNLDVARDFLKSHLPVHIQKRCDFSTLRIKASSFIDEDLRPHMADILYELEINGKPGLIYCVVEAQNIPKKLMPLRMLRYKVAALKKYAEKHPNGPLPVIIPIMLYTGKDSPYPYSINFYDCFADPELARETFLNINLIDLSITADDEIKKHGQVAFLEIVAKHIRDRDIFNLANDLAELLENYYITGELWSHLINYVINSGESENYKEFLNIIIEKTTQHKEETMTIAEQLKLEGEHRGYQKGIHAGIEQGKLEGKLEGEHEAKLVVANNMLSEGADINFVKKVTGLADQDISKLVKSH